jgi:hypothetical protein
MTAVTAAERCRQGSPDLEATGRTPQLSPVLIGLFKGVMYQEQSPDLWQALLQLQSRARDHAGVFGLELVLDEAEGYAYLRQRSSDEGEPELPRLVHRRQLGYAVSLLLALLRKKLAEHDAAGGDTRLILSRTQIFDLVQLFLSAGTNEAKLVDRIDADINRVVEYGFLRRLRGQDDQFEVRRILKAFVDAQWLSELGQRLAEYRAWGSRGESATP